MIKIYISPSSSSCRKVRAFFEEWEIPFTEYNIMKGTVTKPDVLDMLRKSMNGAEEIISTRSDAFKAQRKLIEQMSLTELVDFVVENPTVLRRPIIVDKHKIQVGYNQEDITVFIPREKRAAFLEKIIKEGK